MYQEIPRKVSRATLVPVQSQGLGQRLSAVGLGLGLRVEVRALALLLTLLLRMLLVRPLLRVLRKTY